MLCTNFSSLKCGKKEAELNDSIWIEVTRERDFVTFFVIFIFTEESIKIETVLFLPHFHKYKFKRGIVTFSVYTLPFDNCCYQNNKKMELFLLFV